jgi:hypothetical protein
MLNPASRQKYSSIHKEAQHQLRAFKVSNECASIQEQSLDFARACRGFAGSGKPWFIHPWLVFAIQNNKDLTSKSLTRNKSLMFLPNPVQGRPSDYQALAAQIRKRHIKSILNLKRSSNQLIECKSNSYLSIPIRKQMHLQ